MRPGFKLPPSIAISVLFSCLHSSTLRIFHRRMHPNPSRGSYICQWDTLLEGFGEIPGWNDIACQLCTRPIPVLIIELWVLIADVVYYLTLQTLESHWLRQPWGNFPAWRRVCFCHPAHHDWAGILSGLEIMLKATQVVGGLPASNSESGMARRRRDVGSQAPGDASRYSIGFG